jgi:hypothetical protein
LGAGQVNRPMVIMTPAHQPTNDQPSAVVPTLPQIMSIEGRGMHLSAVLMMPDGGEVVASPGLPLTGGLTVHDINSAGVQVMQAGNLVSLPFETGSGASEPVFQAPPQRTMQEQQAFPPQFPALIGSNMPQ